MGFPTIRPYCQYPGCRNKAMPAGGGRFKKFCTTHHKAQYGIKNSHNQKDRFKINNAREICTACGWIGKCDMHRPHKGSYGGTYKKSNILVVCPNCHRIIHYKENGWSLPTEVCTLCGWVGPCDKRRIGPTKLAQLICPNCRRSMTHEIT